MSRAETEARAWFFDMGYGVKQSIDRARRRVPNIPDAMWSDIEASLRESAK